MSVGHEESTAVLLEGVLEARPERTSVPIECSPVTRKEVDVAPADVEADQGDSVQIEHDGPNAR
jgi:hypothetical protein